MRRLNTERYILSLAIALYISTCYYIYLALNRNIAKVNNHNEKLPALEIKQDRNGSWHILKEDCQVHYVVKHGHISKEYPVARIQRFDQQTCQSAYNAEGHRQNAALSVEKQWPSIDLGYPQYVYTVSGWIQVVQVASYKPKPALHVFVIPHSHQDVGWRETVDECYSGHAKSTLTNMVAKLEEHRNWKFIWAETAFLSKWYDGASDSLKQSLKRAIEDGQLEVVTGGWVMSEEACAHYAPMLDQLIEGHLWLNTTLNFRPTVSWSVDPFGHSPTMAYLLRWSKIDYMVIQRVHYALKRHLARSQKLEFIWRQNWDEQGSSDILCHMMPFLTYAVLYSCGPDPHVCCQFDFYKDKCFRGSKVIKSEPVSDKNINKLAWALWEQYQKKAQLYNSNVLLVPHGDDFRYDTTDEWDKQLGNMEKLMTYMNADKDMNIKVEFGTLRDYFSALAADRKQHVNHDSNVNPVLMGDFFPYNDRDDQYWSGFYSSRPLYKYMARTLQARLRMAEVFYTMTLGRLLKNHDNQAWLLQLDRSIATLQQARGAQATFMHHDAITGTSKTSVVKDYAHLLQKALVTVEELLKLLLVITLELDSDIFSKSNFQMAEEWPVATAPPSFTVAVPNTSLVLITNPLSSSWVHVGKIHVPDPTLRIFTLDGKRLKQQINPVLNWNLQVSDTAYELVFEAELPPLSAKTFRLQPVQQDSSYQHVSLTVFNLPQELFVGRSAFKTVISAEDSFDIENGLLKASFSSCRGTLQHVLRKSDDLNHKAEIKFLTYGTGSWTNPFKDKSGAYIFLPDGPAQDEYIKNPPMVVLRGPVMSSVLTALPGVLHRATLYNVSGPLGAGLHIQNLVNLTGSQWDNRELVMRLVSDIYSPSDDVCVDLNGFQMYRKRWQARRLIQGNFHPVNTMAYIEDGRQMRLSALMYQAHGLASLNSGWLEVILDRRLKQDDWRGMGEGITDNAPTPSSFIILLEKHDKPGTQISIGSPCRPSALAHLLSECLNNPPAIVISDVPAPENQKVLKSEHQFLLPSSFPCNLHLVNFRTLALERDKQSQSVMGASALLVLHRAGLECGISEVHCNCDLKQNLNVKAFQDMRVSRIVRTSLTATEDMEDIPTGEVDVPDMELRTYKILFS